MLSFHDRFLLYPTDRNGTFLYKGVPCPTMSTIQAIGIDGVRELDKKLKLIVDIRAEVIGVTKEQIYGLPSVLHMIDLFRRRFLFVSEIKTDYSTRIQNKSGADKTLEINNLEEYKFLDEKLFKPGNYIVSIDWEEETRDNKDMDFYIAAKKHYRGLSPDNHYMHDEELISDLSLNYSLPDPWEIINKE